MKNIDKIQIKLELLWKDNWTSYAIIINPSFERDIYLNQEIGKSISLEEHFGMPVIISREIKEFHIAI